MRTIAILVLTISIFSCKKEVKTKETLYFLYYGNLKPTIRPMVIKNNRYSYVDTIVEIGRSLDYLINQKEFAKLTSDLNSNNYIFKEEYRKGILCIHYIDKNPVQKYLFSNKSEIADLISNFEGISDTTVKKEAIDWLEVVQRLHPIE